MLDIKSNNIKNLTTMKILNFIQNFLSCDQSSKTYENIVSVPWEICPWTRQITIDYIVSKRYTLSIPAFHCLRE